MNRRKFIQSILAVSGTSSMGLFLPQLAQAKESNVMADFWTKDRMIECKRLDTKEKKTFHFYKKSSGYDNDVYHQMCWFLRDTKDNNASIRMDIGLLNLMYGLQEWARVSGVSNPLITVNSAYRTSRRNARIEGAARNSLHTQGRAVDLTMRGVSLQQLEAMAHHFKVGGVGRYNSFIHIDTGRVRYWRG